MTAPGGGNFFSKAARRAAKAMNDVSTFEHVEESESNNLTTHPRNKTSGHSTVHLEDRDANAKKIVKEAEAKTERKHGKMR